MLSAPSPRLWLARHAHPLIAVGVCYGQLDVPADAAHTLESAQALAHALPAGISVVHSPLQRCDQLVQALRGLRPDLAYQKADARLMEMDFGAWEGCAWEAISPTALQAWTDDFAHYRVGTSGESVAAFMARVAAAWQEARAARVANILWITHAGVIRAVNLLTSGVYQIEQASQWPAAAPGYGQWQTVSLPAFFSSTD